MKPTFMQKIKNFIVTHKILSLVVVLVLVYGGYTLFGKKTTTETRYVTSLAVNGTVVSSVTGSGQVAASNQIDLKPKVAGNVTYIGVNPGDSVKKGKTLFIIDTTSAEKAVRDAQTNLDQANLALAKLKEPANELSVIQAQNAINQATTDKANQDLAVKNAHSALLNSTPEAVPAAVNGVTPINYTPPTITGNYTLDQEGEIDVSVLGAGNTQDYVVSGLATGSGTVSTVVPQPLGNSGLYIKFPAGVTQSVNQWVITLPNVKASNYLSNYNSYQNATQNYQQTIDSDNRTIAENTEKLKELQAGTDALDIQTQELAVTKAQNALLDAKQALSDYYITAPFDGVIASVPAELGQPASSSAALGTIITKQNIAAITLNEVDVAKIKLGDKATLTFDAIDGLSIAGTVVSIDSVGTVTSGVVNYTVKIAFATQDDRVKSGMTVSAAIVTNVAQDVVTVPASAVKTSNGSSYVLEFDTPLVGSDDSTTGVASAVAPHNVPVEVGISDDSTTEITSGLKVGDQVVSRTITTTSTATAAATAPSLLGGSSTRGAAGGTSALRALGR